MNNIGYARLILNFVGSRARFEKMLDQNLNGLVRDGGGLGHLARPGAEDLGPEG